MGVPGAGFRGAHILTDRIYAVREEQSPGAAARGGCSSLGPRMASADDHHVEVRGAGRRAVAAEPGRRKVLSGEGRCDPEATASEGKHAGGNPGLA